MNKDFNEKTLVGSEPTIFRFIITPSSSSFYGQSQSLDQLLGLEMDPNLLFLTLYTVTGAMEGLKIHSNISNYIQEL
jgi:hypothetical protein